MENTYQAPMVQEDKDIMLVTGSQQLMASTPSILAANKYSAERASSAAKILLEEIRLNKNLLTQDLDFRVQQMIIKINATIKKMDELRKPVTQIFSAITKMCTEQEKILDPKIAGTVTYQLQQLRNLYAKQILQEQAQRVRDAAELAEKENQKVTLRAAIANKISLVLSNFRYNKLTQRKASFDSTNLENFNEKEKAITGLVCVFDSTQIKGILTYDIPFTKLDDNTRDMIKKEVQDAYDYSGFGLEYHKLLTEQKQNFLDVLPSKKTELQALATANDAQRLEMDNLRMIREDEEREELRLQKLAQEKVAEDAVIVQTTAAKALTLFEQVSSTTVETIMPEARTGYEIIVLHPAAFVEIFQAWYQKEGIKLPIEDFRKKSVNQMIKFLENAAKSDEFFIKSTFLKYEATAKAVNRKAA